MINQTFVIDIDDTICKNLECMGITKYKCAIPIQPMIDRINELYDNNTIIFHTSRGMRTFNGDINKIEEHHRPILEHWLEKHNVKYHKLIFGKPWGPNVHYIDDRSMTITKFLLKQ